MSLSTDHFRRDTCLQLHETLAYLISIIEEKIREWKKHQLRAVHQEIPRQHVFNELHYTSILLVTDWAMKWLPLKYRESQKDFFGKRALSWHNRFFDIHIVKGIETLKEASDVLILINTSESHFRFSKHQEKIIVVSSLCTFVLITLVVTKKLTCIRIRRFDFFDVQSGKGPCDRMAAVLKATTRRWIMKKNHYVTSSSFANTA